MAIISRATAWLIGAAGTVMLAAATTKPEDAISNVSGWAEIAGFSRLGEFLASPLADWLTGIAGGALLGGVAIWLAAPFVRRAFRRFESRGTPNATVAPKLLAKLVPIGLAGGDNRFHFRLHNTGTTNIQILSYRTNRSIGFESRFYKPGEMMIPEGGSVAVTTSPVSDGDGTTASIDVTYSDMADIERQTASFSFALPIEWGKGGEIEPVKWFSHSDSVPAHSKLDALVNGFQQKAGTLVIVLPLTGDNGMPNFVSFGAHGKMFVFNPPANQAVFSAIDEISGTVESAAAQLDRTTQMQFVAMRWDKDANLLALTVKPMPIIADNQ